MTFTLALSIAIAAAFGALIADLGFLSLRTRTRSLVLSMFAWPCQIFAGALVLVGATSPEIRRVPLALGASVTPARVVRRAHRAITAYAKDREATVETRVDSGEGVGARDIS